MVALGGIILLTGVLFLLFGRTTFLGRLPGDIRISNGNFTCIAPIATMLLLSLVLTVILNLLARFFNR